MVDPQFVRNDSKHRYEAVIDGEAVGFSEYRDRGSVRDVFHTEVDTNWEGNGFATRIVQFALADIRSSGLTLVPSCPVVKRYVEKHPEEHDLLEPR